MLDLFAVWLDLAERLPDMGVVHLPVGPVMLAAAVAAQVVFERFHGR